MMHVHGDTAKEVTGRGAAITGDFLRRRSDLPDGREWLVTTHDDPSGKEHAYVVTIWVEPELGRIASCRCDGFTKGGRCCRHILFIRVSDSILYNVKCREIRPVPFEYAKAA